MKRIALVKDRNKFWEVYHDILKKNGYDVQLIDIFNRSEHEQVLSSSFDAFIWRAKHTPSVRDLARRFIYFFDVERGIPTFPTWKEFWHYDDKIAQYFMFREKNIPIPDTYLFFSKDEAMTFADTATYPLVFKCPHGAGSSNVGLLKKKSEGFKYIKKAFGKGIQTYFKSDIQRGYVLFQEFLENNPGDYRLVCHGQNHISGFFRHNMKNAPFASGSGEFDLGDLSEDLLTFTARIHERLDYDIMSYDILKDNDRNWVVTEMSVIFGDLSHVVYDQAPVYEKTRQGDWHRTDAQENRHVRFIRHLLKRWNWHE